MLRFFQLLCIGLLLSFMACSSSENTRNDGSSLRVGLNAEYPPFEYKKDDAIVGFDIDLINIISQKVGFDITLHHMSFDGLIPALKSGKIDLIISGMSATPERMKAVDFSIPYYEGQTLFMKHKDSEEIIDKETIRGKTVGVYIGTVQEQAINKMKSEYGLSVVPSDSIFGAIMNLKNKKVDVVLADYATAQGYLQKNKELVGFYQESDGSEGLSIAFDKNKHTELLKKVNDVIMEIRQSGEYEALLEKYELKLK